MPKTPCPTCDHPLEPFTPCRACAALAAFSSLPPVDRAGNGALGYVSNTRAYESERPPRPWGPRFLCLSDLEVLVEGECDAAGIDVTGEDRFGAWFGTAQAPCIVKGDSEGSNILFTLHGERLDRTRGNKDWTGYYIGSYKNALLEVPDHVVIKYVETTVIKLY